MTFRRFSISLSLAAVIAAGCGPKVATPHPPQASVRLLDTGIKYMRDSEDYATLARQMYRLATDAVTRAAAQSPAQPWAVVLDIDETALDNSTYQVERAELGLAYDETSWNAWVNRRQAPAVPGVVDFIAAARRAGAHIAWITNRTTVVETATRDNLKSVGLWSDDDRLCAQSGSRTKRVRRTEVIRGHGECAWPGRPTPVVAFIGDQLGDFPERDENVPNAGTDAAFGKTCFLLPNSMYGGWTTKATRIR